MTRVERGPRTRPRTLRAFARRTRSISATPCRNRARLALNNSARRQRPPPCSSVLARSPPSVHLCRRTARDLFFDHCTAILGIAGQSPGDGRGASGAIHTRPGVGQRRAGGGRDRLRPHRLRRRCRRAGLHSVRKPPSRGGPSTWRPAPPASFDQTSLLRSLAPYLGSMVGADRLQACGRSIASTANFLQHNAAALIISQSRSRLCSCMGVLGHTQPLPKPPEEVSADAVELAAPAECFMRSRNSRCREARGHMNRGPLSGGGQASSNV